MLRSEPEYHSDLDMTADVILADNEENQERVVSNLYELTGTSVSREVSDRGMAVSRGGHSSRGASWAILSDTIFGVGLKGLHL